MPTGLNINSYIEGISEETWESEIIPSIQETLIRIRFLITEVCNANCFFCHKEGFDGTKEGPKGNIMHDRIIDSLKRLGVNPKFSYTGGEPLLYPKKLFPHISYSRENFPDSYISITTNGLLLEKRIPELLNSGIDGITISLHTLDKDRYKQIYGVDGLKTVISGLKALKKGNFQIKINMVVGRNNFDEIGAMKQFCEENGFSFFLLSTILLDENYKDQVMSIDEIENITGKWTTQRRKELLEKCKNCPEINKCSIEYGYLRVSPEGVLSPCLGLKKHNIDLREISEENFDKAVALGARRIFSLEVPDYKLHHTTSPAVIKMKEQVRPYKVEVLGKKFTVFPDVWSPLADWSGTWFSEELPELKDKDFLEIGPGTGIISVHAGLKGAKRITAFDINPSAVDNTNENLSRFEIKDAEAVLSDLFEKAVGKKFDFIVWNAPFHGCKPNELIEHGCADENYNSSRRFFNEVGNYLNDGGKIMYMFSTSGDVNLVESLMKENNLVIEKKLIKVQDGYDCLLYFLVKE